MDLGEELNALYTDVLHNRCIFTVKLSKLICHAPKLGIIFYTHYRFQIRCGRESKSDKPTECLFKM